MSKSFKSLLEEGIIGRMSVRNRIVMPPMVRNYADAEGMVTTRLADHYAAAARGGTGLIIVEASFVHLSGKGFRQQIGIHDDQCIPGLNYLAETIKDWGARAAIQLHHAGRQTSSPVTGASVVAPSAIPCPVVGGLPEALSTEEVAEMVEHFARAARRAQQAGFDAVEIHAAHGYLINQFLSPLTNRRTDKYGGDLDARFTFAAEIMERTRELVGNSYPIIVRMNATDYVEGGLTLEEGRVHARRFQAAGADALSVSAGAYECLLNLTVTSPFGVEPTYAPHGQIIDYAGDIKEEVRVPVITVGGITPELGEEALSTRKADFIAIGRNLLVDPDLPDKLRRNQRQRVRPCIRCNEQCMGRLFEGFSIGCAVNAEVGFESYGLRTPLERKKVLVAGGGPAGMEAARLAALRGHDVQLYEKSDELGGHLKEATVADFKTDLRHFKEWLIRELKYLGVEVTTGRAADPGLVADVNPDVLVAATGSGYSHPPIAGAEKAVTATDILLGNAKPGTKNIVAGGGSTGCETALFLGQQGKAVTVLEMKPEVADDIPMINRGQLLTQLMKAGVEIITDSKVVEVTDDHVVIVDRSQSIKRVPSDRVILAVGLSSERTPVEPQNTAVPEVYLIGDCVEPRRVGEAVREGYRVGSTI